MESKSINKILKFWLKLCLYGVGYSGLLPFLLSFDLLAQKNESNDKNQSDANQIIKLKKIKKTDYKDDLFENQRNNKYLNLDKLNRDEGLELRSNNKSIEGVANTTPLFKVSDFDFNTSVEYGLGNDFIVQLGLIKLINKDYISFDLFAEHRDFIAILTSGVPTTPNSGLNIINFDFKLNTSLNRDTFRLKERYFTRELQSTLTGDLTAQNFGLGLDYGAKRIFDSFIFTPLFQSFFGRYHTGLVDTDSYYATYYLSLFSKVDFVLIKGAPGLKLGGSYAFDGGLSHSRYRHLFDVQLGYTVNFAEWAYLDLKLLLMAYHHNDLPRRKSTFNIFLPYVVMPQLFLSLQWIDEFGTHLGAKVDYQRESFESLYEERINVEVNALPTLDRFAEFNLDFVIRVNDWINWELGGLYQYYFTKDQYRINQAGQYYTAYNHDIWVAGANSILKFTYKDLLVLSSEVLFRHTPKVGIIPKLVNRNRLEFIVVSLGSKFGLSYDWVYQDKIVVDDQLSGNAGILDFNHQIFSLSYFKSLKSGFTLFLKLNNILNNQYLVTSPNVVGPGRSISIGFKYKL